MAFSRYTRDSLALDGKGYSTSVSIAALRAHIKQGNVAIGRVITATQGDRLDTLAGALYGDGGYWWVLAAASNVGWGLQIPPGTLISVPDLKAVEAILG